MFDWGSIEIFVILIIALLVLGPERLPKVIKYLAYWLKKVKGMAEDVREQLEREANLSEIRKEVLTSSDEKSLKDLSQTMSEVATELSDNQTKKGN